MITIAKPGFRGCCAALLVMLLLCLIPNAGASDKFSWNLYGTVGVGKVDDEQLLNATKVPYSNYTNNFSFKTLTRLGIKAGYQASDKLSFTLQALAENDFEPELEWSYLSYKLTSNTTLKLGKMRRPLFHYSDSYSLGFAYDWVKPPSAVYYEFQELYGDVDAIDLYHRGIYGDWNYSLQGYFGSGSGKGVFLQEKMAFDTKNNTGIVVGLEKQDLNFRLGYHVADYTIESSGLTQAVAGLNALGFANLAANVEIKDQHAEFISVSGSYLLPKDWKLFGEYAEMNSPDTLLVSIDSFYTGLQRSFGSYTLHYTYGRQAGDASNDYVTPIKQQADQLQTISPPAAGGLNAIAAGLDRFIGNQHIRRYSHAIGLRYDIEQTIALKLEVENTTDRTQDSNAMSYSFGVDFIY